MGAQVTTPPPPPHIEEEYVDSSHSETQFHVLEFHLPSTMGGVAVIAGLAVAGCCLNKLFARLRKGANDRAMAMANLQAARANAMMAERGQGGTNGGTPGNRGLPALTYLTESGNTFGL